MNQQELATAEDVSTKTVASWIRKGCPVARTKIGGYVFDLKKVQRWRADNLAPQPTVPSTLLEARRRKETAMAGLRELELRKRKGELVLKESVVKEIFAMFRTARDKMFNIPDRVSGILAAESDQLAIHAILTKEIHQICLELSNAE